MATLNRQIKFASRPTGMVTASNFQLVETPLPVAAEGQVLLKTLYLSVDPYMRGFMSTRASYAAPMEIGDVMIGGTVSEVIESRNSGFQAGDIVEGRSGWQAYAIDDGKMLRKIDPAIAPISTALGILGMPGLTAYFGLLEIGKPKAGETVLVSGAAGAVGLAVGQIAKIMGCRAVGTAGSDVKVRLLTAEYGFDGAVNYKTAGKLRTALAEHCAKGVDVYFDNVGGEVTDAAFDLLNTGARIPVCGQISSYCADKPDVGPRLLWHLIVKQARAEGFLVYQFAAKYKEAIPQMAAWVREGKLKYQESITEGLENAPQAFIGLFKGENTGKQLVKVA